MDDGNAIIAELLAKRAKGNVGSDNVLHDLGSYPPAKAHPLPSGVEAPPESPRAAMEGFEAALVPFTVEPIPLSDFRGPKLDPLNIQGILEILYRHDEGVYREATAKTHVLFVPNDFYDELTATRLRPFFQYMGAFDYGMRQRRAQLLDDVDEVDPWHKRYAAELGFLRQKQERLRRRGEELGHEVPIFAAAVLSSVREEEIEPRDVPAAVAFRCLLDYHAPAREAFKAWLKEGSDRHSRRQNQHGGAGAEPPLDETAAAASKSTKGKKKSKRRATETTSEPPPAFVDGNGGDRLVLDLLHGTASPAAALDFLCFQHLSAWLAATAAAPAVSTTSRGTGRKASGLAAVSLVSEMSSLTVAQAGAPALSSAETEGSIEVGVGGSESQGGSLELGVGPAELEEMHAAIFRDLRSPFMVSEAWAPLMTQLRILRGAGGQLPVDDGSRIEYDAQGVPHVVPDADRYIDSDCLTPGSIQRLKIELIESKLMALVAFSAASMRRDLGEVAAMTQYAYGLAAPHPQRVFRGWRARVRCKDLRGYFRFIALTAAALEIQRFVRASTARSIINALRSGQTQGSVLVIQKVWRGALARMRLARMKEAKAAGVRLAASFSIQRVWRGYAAQRHYREALAAGAREDYRVAFAWALVTVQRFVRGHQAKAQVVQKRLELRLSDRLQRLAHKYLQSGDLWGFLKAVDDDYQRYEKSQGEILAREDELAATFVEKVVMARERQVKDGWDMYHTMSAARKRGGAGSTASQRPGTSASTPSAPGPRLRRVVESGLQMLDEAQMADEARSAGAGLKKAFPVYSKSSGPGAGRSFGHESATDGGNQPTTPWGDSVEPLSSRSGRATPGTSAGGSRCALASPDRRDRNRPASSVRFAGASPGSAKGSRPGSSGALPTTPDAALSPGSTQAEESRPGSHGGAEASDDHHGTHGGLHGSHHGHGRKKGVSALPQPPAMPGLSVVKDLPGGLDDTVERLVRAAGLRVFVPGGMVPAGTTAAVAFQHFRGLPPDCLARVRWEVLLGEWCAPVVDKLRARGCLFIKDLLPMKRFVALAHQTAIPPALATSCRSCIRELRSSGIKPIGRGVLHTKERYCQISEGVLTVGQITNTGGPAQFVGAKSFGATGDADKAGRVASHDEFGGEGSVSVNEFGSNPVSAEDEAVYQLVGFLREDVQSWGSLEGDVKIFLQRAAFYVVPHGADLAAVDRAQRARKEKVVRPGTGPGAAGQGVGVHPAALVDFARDMVAAGWGGLSERNAPGAGESAASADGFDDDDSGAEITRHQRTGRVKELLRERLQAALLFSTPFVMRFVAGGVKTTRDLLRCRLQDWGLRGDAEGDSTFANPDRLNKALEASGSRGGVGEYRFQVESMLRVLVANEQAREGTGALFVSDGAGHAALNATVVATEALRGTAGSTTAKARPAVLIAGYGRSDPFAKQSNPFLSDVDRVLVLGANANGNNGFAPPLGSSSMSGSGPIPQRKLAFDPRFQRGPWDPTAKQPRSHRLAPTLKPPAVLKVDWDKEDGIEAQPSAQPSGGAHSSLLSASTNADSNDELPPPPGQTFEEAERLEAERDLPPGLWEPKEFVAGAYGRGGVGGLDGAGAGGADRFIGLWPNTAAHFTKVRLGQGGRDLGSVDLSREVFDGVSGDPFAPDPLHPNVSANYTKPGSAVMGVAGQSRIRHPNQIMGGDASSGAAPGEVGAARDAHRRAAAERRIARTVAAEVKVRPGFEHQQPKVFHSKRTGLTFSSRAELKRYEKVHSQFGEYERYSMTPQLGRDLPPQLSDGGSLAIAADDAAATMRSMGRGGSEGASRKIGMGGLSLGSKLQAELEELAAVAAASSIMTGSVLGTVRQGQSSTAPASFGTSTRTSRSRPTAELNKRKPALASTALLKVPSNQFFGDSRGESASAIIGRRMDNGEFFQGGTLGLGLLSVPGKPGSGSLRQFADLRATQPASAAANTVASSSVPRLDLQQNQPTGPGQHGVNFGHTWDERLGSTGGHSSRSSARSEELSHSEPRRGGPRECDASLDITFVSAPQPASVAGRRRVAASEKDAPVVAEQPQGMPVKAVSASRGRDTGVKYYSSDEESPRETDESRAPSAEQPGGTALDTAEAVRLRLIRREVDAAASARDFETMVELLAIAKAMPFTSPAADHVLLRAAEILEAAAAADLRAEAAQVILDAAADDDEEAIWEEKAASKGETVELKDRRKRDLIRAGKRQRARAEAKAARGGRGTSGRKPFEALSDAGLAEGCVDVMRARALDANTQIVAARVLAALCAPMDPRDCERVLQDIGAGRALADAARKHGNASVKVGIPMMIRDTCRAAAKAMGLGTKPEAATPVAKPDEALGSPSRRRPKIIEEVVVVDPLTALLRDRRFFDDKMMRAASRG